MTRNWDDPSSGNSDYLGTKICPYMPKSKLFMWKLPTKSTDRLLPRGSISVRRNFPYSSWQELFIRLGERTEGLWVRGEDQVLWSHCACVAVGMLWKEKSKRLVADEWEGSRKDFLKWRSWRAFSAHEESVVRKNKCVIKGWNGAGKIAHYIKVIAAKPDHPSSVLHLSHTHGLSPDFHMCAAHTQKIEANKHLL